MSILNDFKKKTEAMNEAIQTVRLELTAKEKLLENKKKEKVDLILSGLTGTVSEAKVSKLTEDIRNIELELTELSDRVELYETESRKALAKELEPVKAEREKLSKRLDKDVQAMEKGLFQAKYTYMKELKEAQEKRESLQAQIEEYNSLIQGIDDRDRRKDVKPLLVTNERMRRYQGDAGENALGIDPVDLEKLQSGTHHSLELFLLTGELAVNEIEAFEKLKEVRKNG